jgi:hypothetical protein
MGIGKRRKPPEGFRYAVPGDGALGVILYRQPSDWTKGPVGAPVMLLGEALTEAQIMKTRMRPPNMREKNVVHLAFDLAEERDERVVSIQVGPDTHWLIRDA